MHVKGLVFAAVLGALGVVPAHGFPYWNNATYAARFRPAQAPAPEFQIGVLASPRSAATAAAPESHPWGPPRPCAARSH